MKTLLSLSFLVLITTTQMLAQRTAFEVVVEGSGEPILLFPGFSCAGEVWNDTVALLSKDYECHVFTFAGFAGVAPVEGNTPWLTQVKESVEDYVEQKKLNKPHLLGHSLGGALSLWLASENTGNYGKLFIVDGLPSIGALMMPNYDNATIVYDNPYSNQMLAMNEKAFETMALQMAGGMTTNKEKIPQLVKWMKTSDRKTYVHGYTDLLKLDLRTSIAKINNPVTVLVATFPYGPEMATNTYRNQYKALESYNLKLAEGSAHFIMYDKPVWFQAQVKEAFNIQ